MKFEILYFLIVLNSYLHQYQVGKVVDKVGVVYNEEGYEDDQLHLYIEGVCFPMYIT